MKERRTAFRRQASRLGGSYVASLDCCSSGAERRRRQRSVEVKRKEGVMLEIIYSTIHGIATTQLSLRQLASLGLQLAHRTCKKKSKKGSEGLEKKGVRRPRDRAWRSTRIRNRAGQQVRAHIRYHKKRRQEG